jgi:hypothetical protein
MPERGRMKILTACPTDQNGQVAHLEMPREELVPYGGAAPIDVFAIRVEDTAILALVTASWHNKRNVMNALAAGATTLGEMIRKAKRLRAQKTGTRKGTEAPKRERLSSLPGEPKAAEPKRERLSSLPGEPKRERLSSLPGEPKRERLSSLPGEPKRGPSKKLPRAEPPPLPRAASRRRSSEPDIVLGEAAVGRETLAAIEPFLPRASEDERPSSAPEIVLGEATVGRETLVAIEGMQRPVAPGPTPLSVRVQLDSIGRETLAEIHHIEVQMTRRGPTVDEPLVKQERSTLPWVDGPEALKRAVDAKAAARGIMPPELKVKVVEMDPETQDLALREKKRQTPRGR